MKCKPGSYYCYTDKKCKPIPAGFMVDPEGMLRKENGASIDKDHSINGLNLQNQKKENLVGLML